MRAEEAVLGGVALLGTVPPSVLDVGLKPEHFYYHAETYSKALQLYDQGLPIDSVTLPALDPFTGGTPHLADIDAYAKRVRDKALWRKRLHAGYEIINACEVENEDEFAKAETQLKIARESDRVFDDYKLGTLMYERLQAESVPGWTMPFLPQRLVPGTVHLWGGWTSHGKTVWVDQIARSLKTQGAKTWAWLNEMTAEERMCRHASALTGLPLNRVQENDLSEHEKAKIVPALARIPYGIVECPGWSAEDICRDIRIRRPDVAIIDILHRIPYRDERDLARISQLLGDTAKLARCCVLATVHLNRGRIQGAARPQPTMSDIKGASAFEQDADLVGMVWREDDDVTGRPQDNGMIYTLKVRMGVPSGTPVIFDGMRAQFTQDLTQGWSRDGE